VVVNRSLHRSLLLGLVLADLEPCWLPTRIDPVTGMPIGVAVGDVEATLAANPDARAVIVTEPGYLGTLSDLRGIIEVAHRRDVPVIVDQAWGAHFGHHPDLPPHAMALGADAMVTSIHKLLLGYTQASLVCARTLRLDHDRLERGFEASHTTSAAGSVLASIDATRAFMDARGEELLTGVIRNVAAARKRLREAVPGLGVPDEHSFPPGRFDTTRLVLLLSGVGANGIEIERRLIDEGLPLELADRDTIVAIVSVADDESTLDRLVRALIPAILETSGPPRAAAVALSWDVQPIYAMSPRAAFFSAHESVPADLAVGRDVVRTDVVKLVDLGFRHELVDLDRLRTFERDGLQFVVRDLDVFALGDFVALDDLVRRDFLAGLLVHLAVADAVAGLAVDLVEADLLALGRGGIKGDRTRDQRQSQISLPVCTRCHG